LAHEAALDSRNCGLANKNRRPRSEVACVHLSSRQRVKGGKSGKQDKGSVSRHCITLCLHILFPRDSNPELRDCRPRSGENAPFPPRNRETRGRWHA
jgi:hypothetical protein